MIEKSKKLILFIGIIILLVILVCNVFFHTSIEDKELEHVVFSWQSISNVFLEILIVIGILIVCKITNNILSEKTKKVKIIVLGVVLIIYLIAQILFINYRDLYPYEDQLGIYQFAVEMYNSDSSSFFHVQYFEKYPHQIGFAVVESIIFKICGSTNVKIIQYLNAISNCFTILALVLIANLITKNKRRNIALSAFIILTFLPIPLLSTYMYGDEIGLTLSLFSLYFIMKFTKENRDKYFVISIICMAISYICKINSLIFIIAISMYLVYHALKQPKEKKLNVFLSIVVFIVCSIIPNKVLVSCVQSKYQFDKSAKVPTSHFLYMGMTESDRGYGWFNDEASYTSWNNDSEQSDKIHKEAIKNRLFEFAKNPLYCIRFYILKIASMWAENTNQSIYFNESFSFQINKDYEKR